MKKINMRWFVPILLMCVCVPMQANYSAHSKANEFVERMEQYGFRSEDVLALLRLAKPNTDVLKLIAKPAERVLPWSKYRTIFVNDTMVQSGVSFARTYRTTLTDAERQYGVPSSIILGILGVETRYGERMGNFPVLDALATLAFDYRPRAKFFQGELASYMVMVRDEGISPTDILGSYAGAFGFGQFIPSSYRAYAVDFDGDGRRDLINSIPDAIGSIANYLAKNGWHGGDDIVVPAVLVAESNQLRPVHTVRQIGWLGLIPERPLAPEKQGRAIFLDGAERPEYWIGLHNFWVITRYNRSEKYAMAVYQLGQSITSVLEREDALDEDEPDEDEEDGDDDEEDDGDEG